MGGGSLLFKYHYNTKLKDGNYSIPTKETSRRRPLATALGSLKLFLSTSRKTEEKQKGLATAVAVFIIGLQQHRHTQTQVSVLTTFPSRHLPKSRPGRPLQHRAKEVPCWGSAPGTGRRRLRSPTELQHLPRTALRASPADPSPPRSPGVLAAPPALGTSARGPGRRQMTRRPGHHGAKVQNNG